MWSISVLIVVLCLYREGYVALFAIAHVKYHMTTGGVTVDGHINFSGAAILALRVGIF